MSKYINQEVWAQIYLRLYEKVKRGADPIEVGDMLAENDLAPIFERIDFKATFDLGKLHFKDLIVTNCEFNKNPFTGSYFTRTIFRGCEFKDVNLDQCVFENCLFENCKFSGLRVFQSGIQSTIFITSKLRQCQFQESIFSDVLLVRSDFQESDFLQCVFQNASFSSSNLSHSTWHRCELKEVSVMRGTFEGTCFWQNIFRNVSVGNSDLSECLMLESSGEPLVVNCIPRSVTKPVVGVSWNYNTRLDYAPIIARAIRNSGAIVLKIEVEPREILDALLKAEVTSFIVSIKESFPREYLSIPEEIIKRASDDSEIGRLRFKAYLALQYCGGLVLPGGSDLQPEFYGAERDSRTDKVKGFRRSIVEFALLFRANQIQLPTLGICRGAQLVNVYFGGTLKQHVENQFDHEKLQLVHLSDSSRKEEFFSYFGSDFFPSLSLHHQVIDKVGTNLEVICEYNCVPKLLLSPDNQYIACQTHPEIFTDLSLFPEEFKPAECGELIYKLFMEKVDEYCAISRS